MNGYKALIFVSLWLEALPTLLGFIQPRSPGMALDYRGFSKKLGLDVAKRQGLRLLQSVGFRLQTLKDFCSSVCGHFAKGNIETKESGRRRSKKNGKKEVKCRTQTGGLLKPIAI